MKFDPALIADVHNRAPAGMRFERVEVERALRWAYDVRATGSSPLDPYVGGTAAGIAAAEALAAYRPAAPATPGPGRVALRLTLFALFATGVTLVLVLVLGVLARLVGLRFGVTGTGVLVALMIWAVAGWLLRDRIKLLEPEPNRYAVPAQRTHEPDPIATTMTGPELQAREPAPGGTERATP